MVSTETRYDTILLDRIGHTALLTLNRPENLNAYNETMHEDLRNAWQEINADDDIWTIVVRGAGRAFCTGADVKEAATAMTQGKLGAPRWEAFSDTINRFKVTSIRRLMGTGLPVPQVGYPSKPMISAIHGICCGDGLGWLYRADFAICSEGATFFDPHVNVCISPPGIQMLGRNTTRPMTFAIMGMGLYWRIDAQRAYELGLVSEIVSEDRLQDRALEIAEQVNTYSSPVAVRATKAYYWSTHDLPWEQARAWARVYDNQVRFQSADAIEGHRAYHERRMPRWTGR
jgi:enoyl-CoA hydratase/carnithine racemase